MTYWKITYGLDEDVFILYSTNDGFELSLTQLNRFYDMNEYDYLYYMKIHSRQKFCTKTIKINGQILN